MRELDRSASPFNASENSMGDYEHGRLSQDDVDMADALDSRPASRKGPGASNSRMGWMH